MADDTFDAAWLALREPADHRSRSAELLPFLRAEGEDRGWRRVLDLGAGTGSNLRYLARRLPWAREWTLLDHDPHLLLRAEAPVEGCTVERRPGDLAREGLACVSRAELVTASALLDLVPASWLETLADRCASAGCGVLFALSYDGEVEWGDEDPDDALLLEAVNAHQVREKGMGPALGPRSAFLARDLFRERGYRCWLRPSPWELGGPGDGELGLALVRGWVEAAVEMRPEVEECLREWGERRMRTVASGRFHVRVGHRDLLALPGGL